VKSIGLALAGLGLVFFGLEIMSSAMSSYKSSPAVQNLLTSLNNPFLLLIFGVVFTALLQSSSAVTTIIIAMAGQGLLIGGGGNAVLYIILGSNIGSCVTALISSIGTSVNARRASIMHLLFNAIGTVLFTVMLLIWSKDVVGNNFYDVTFAKWFDKPTTEIAMFHTFFNVTCTLLFLPFSKTLVKASEVLVREKKQTEREPWELMYMDKRLLATPAVALGQLKKETFRMADMSMESVNTAFNCFINRDVESLETVYTANETISKISEQISNYLVHVSASGVSYADEMIISALHSNIGDIARIAELADNFTKYTKREVKDNLTFSEGINEKLQVMHQKLQDQYVLVKKIMLEKNYSLMPVSDALEDEIDTMRKDLVAEHIVRLGQGKCRPENNTIFVNLVCNLERIGDHLNFIAHSLDNN
jgi:phosphate:Na+ symporter